MGVTTTDPTRNPAALIAAAASNPAVSDRALRCYVVLATTHERGATAAEIAHALPGMVEREAALLLGRLVTAGLLEKRLKTVGYRGGNRVRRSHYTLAGGEA